MSLPTETTSSRRAVMFGAIVLVAVLLGLGYVLFARNRVSRDIAERQQEALEVVDRFEQDAGDRADPPAMSEPPTVLADVGTDDPAEDAGEPIGPVAKPGEVIVIHRVPGDDYGRLAIRHADKTRTLLDRSCERVHVSAGRGICMARDGGIIASYSAIFFDATQPDLPEIKSYEVPLPSRARVSADGTLASTTSFIAGSTYEDISTESSTVVTIDAFEADELVGLHGFYVQSDDPAYSEARPKYWGVTFIDNDSFYATGLFGDQPEVVYGSIAAGEIEPTGFMGSCPSLSPDGRTLVFKQSRDGGGFDLVAVDLESGDVTMLGEKRSVDDQVEWLDDDTILYAMHPEEGEADVQPQFDIWMLDIAPGAEPEMFLPAADSPAVIR